MEGEEYRKLKKEIKNNPPNVIEVINGWVYKCFSYWIF
jgi:hypothetical protein